MYRRASQYRKYVIPIVGLAIFLLGWEYAVRATQINPIVLPPPSMIFIAFLEDWRYLLEQVSITMLEAVTGFIIGSAFAYFLASVFVFSNTIRMAIYPYAVALKSTPLITIAPLLILWFGSGIESKIVMSAVICFFPVLVNSFDGLTNPDQELVDVMRALSANKFQTFLKVQVPQSLPLLFSALKVSSSLAVVGAVIGEYTGSTMGIGHVINTSSYYFQIDTMFASIILVSLFGVIFFILISLLHIKLKKAYG